MTKIVSSATDPGGGGVVLGSLFVAVSVEDSPVSWNGIGPMGMSIARRRYSPGMPNANGSKAMKKDCSSG